MAFNSRRFRNFFPPLFDELFELVIEEGVVVQSDTWSDRFMSLTNWLTTDTEKLEKTKQLNIQDYLGTSLVQDYTIAKFFEFHPKNINNL